MLDKGAGLAPVAEVNGGRALDAAEVDDEAKDDEKDDEKDFENGKEELDLAEHADETHANDDGEDDEGNDPDGRVDVGPKLKEHANGRDFGRDRQQVAVHEVPPNGEAPGRVNEEFGVPHKGASHGQQRADLAKRKLHGADDEANGCVAEEGAERAASLDGATEAKEQSRANGAGDAKHGQVALAEAASEISLLSSRDKIGALGAEIVTAMATTGIVAVVARSVGRQEERPVAAVCATGGCRALVVRKVGVRTVVAGDFNGFKK